MAVLYFKLCILCSCIVQFPICQFPLDDIYGISHPRVEETSVHAFEGKWPVVACEACPHVYIHIATEKYIDCIDHNQGVCLCDQLFVKLSDQGLSTV